MHRVTVIMPAYNVGPWIHEAIESVLKQTFTDFTLLVIDDCSTDNTGEVVRSFSDSRIRYEKNPQNLGLADNLNRGLELSDTEFCARMDGDDIAEPMWLETGVKVLDSHPEIGICSFGFQFFGTKNSVVRFPEWNEDSKVQMLFGCTVIVPVFRRSVMVDNGLRYRTETFPAEDYDMWSRCYRVTQVYNVQETMFHYRMHETQISTSKAEAQRLKSDSVRKYMLEWLSNDLTDDDKQYFLNEFIAAKIKTKSQLAQIYNYAKYLLSKNEGHYLDKALKNRFKVHISQLLYYSVINSFFCDGYSIRKYFHYLQSGIALRMKFMLELKIITKSLISYK